ncbi:hypothetical protein THRCLA_20125 [Thraustotheca clavata]|uniref:Uncharacterized protein n=1 Tax=Thraustotheca clavata TaxID=74557 RepID=A0A1W0ABJ6_9STRA|nr:hypothetical protein THRCLA_20125 [Thraustotheca clavata]
MMMEGVVALMEKSSTFATFFGMLLVSTVAAQYCEFYFLRFLQRCTWAPKWLQTKPIADQSLFFYESYVLLGLTTWATTVIAVTVWELNRRTWLGLVYSLFTGLTYGIAQFFQQYTTTTT